MCGVLGKNTLLSPCLSPPKSIKGTAKLSEKPDKMRGFTLRYTGISSRWGSSDTPLSHHTMETGISSGLVGYWARVQTYEIFIVTAKVSEMR